MASLTSVESSIRQQHVTLQIPYFLGQVLMWGLRMRMIPESVLLNVCFLYHPDVSLQVCEGAHIHIIGGPFFVTEVNIPPQNW